MMKAERSRGRKDATGLGVKMENGARSPGIRECSSDSCNKQGNGFSPRAYVGTWPADTLTLAQ